MQLNRPMWWWLKHDKYQWCLKYFIAHKHTLHYEAKHINDDNDVFYHWGIHHSVKFNVQFDWVSFQCIVECFANWKIDCSGEGRRRRRRQMNRVMGWVSGNQLLFESSFSFGRWHCFRSLLENNRTKWHSKWYLNVHIKQFTQFTINWIFWSLSLDCPALLSPIQCAVCFCVTYFSTPIIIVSWFLKLVRSSSHSLIHSLTVISLWWKPKSNFLQRCYGATFLFMYLNFNERSSVQSTAATFHGTYFMNSPEKL